MGFRQESITYDKQARLHGKSGWNFSKKLKLAIDSVTSFSFLPVRVMSVIGFIVALIGFLYAGFIVYRALTDANPVPGWTSLMVVVLIMGGIQMLMMGILGEYLWRTLDETRRRPRYIIEDQINCEDSD
jgi:dolichol-phosphate mannosyltransferase